MIERQDLCDVSGLDSVVEGDVLRDCQKVALKVDAARYSGVFICGVG